MKEMAGIANFGGGVGDENRGHENGRFTPRCGGTNWSIGACQMESTGKEEWSGRRLKGKFDWMVNC